MKNVITFVRTLLTPVGAPIPHHRMWVKVLPSPPPGLGDRRFSVVTLKTAQTKASETHSQGYKFGVYARSLARQPLTQTP